MIEHSKLKDHTLKKGVFTTPFNNLFGDKLVLSSWAKERLPEYLWMGLIIKKYERTRGLCLLGEIINKIIEFDVSFQLPYFSNILKLDNDIQQQFWSYCLQKIDSAVLEPLTVLYPFKDYPVFNRFFQGCTETSKCVSIIQEVLGEAYATDSYLGTDIRFCVLLFQTNNGMMQWQQAQITLLNQYPNTPHESDAMQMIRPLIRAAEMSPIATLANQGDTDCNQSDKIWERLSEMTDCQLKCLTYQPHADGAELYKNYLHEIFQYLEESYLATDPLNKRYLVILGLSSFAYKRVKELVEHNLFIEISGRNIARSLIEILIMLKYLLKHEHEKDDIWDDYQRYGYSAYKKIVGINRDTPYGFADGHANYKYMELLVNNYCNEEFVDIDVRYFAKSPKENASDVGEEELYKLLYDYDSSFEHGLWGAISESALLLCNNPAHQFHFVLDCNDNQKLPSVWKDCVRVMNKILTIVNDEISIPAGLMDEVRKFE